MNRLSFDIFCQVIDNYGDIGVCWRLAKQLSHLPFNANVRLWVDEIAVFKKLQPKITLDKKIQSVDDVQIILWDGSNQNMHDVITPNEVVIEAFACDIPDKFKTKLNNKNNIWLNLEYLSAEKWVKEFHLQPSPQPNGLVKYFYMPGFINGTGGLIREANLQKNTERPSLFKTLEINNINTDTFLIMYFCYANARFDLLLKSLAKHNQNQSITILIPQGLKLNHLNSDITNHTGLVTSNDLKQILGFDIPKNIQVFIIPFVDQSTFDQILFNADINFVRGEDSLVRAIWAQKPFIWQPYIQDENTHLKKLNALLDLSPFNDKTKQLVLDWSNLSGNFVDEFSQFLSKPNYIKWCNATLEWSRQLANRTDLATALVDFIKTKRDYDIR